MEKLFPALEILQVRAPVTAVDVAIELPGTPLSFGRKETKVGPVALRGCVALVDCAFDLGRKLWERGGSPSRPPLYKAAREKQSRVTSSFTPYSRLLPSLLRLMLLYLRPQALDFPYQFLGCFPHGRTLPQQ